MIKAETADKMLIIDILSQSFMDNQSVNYIVFQDKYRIQRIRALMDYSFEVCSLFGDIWLSDDKQACALILYPHLKETTLKVIFLDLKLIVQTIGFRNIQKAMNREKQVKEKQPRISMAYLWFIGVFPSTQHQGTGSLLLEQVCQEAGDRDLPIYLETSTLQNLPWYERLGFQIYDKLELTYTLYFLKRLPGK